MKKGGASNPTQPARASKFLRKGQELLPSRLKLPDTSAVPPSTEPSLISSTSNSCVEPTSPKQGSSTAFHSKTPKSSANLTQSLNQTQGGGSGSDFGWRGDELLRSLQALQRVRDVELEKQRFGCKPGMSWRESRKIDHPPKRYQPKGREFEFTKDMFTSGVDNMPALLAVLHFLFEQLDPEATKLKFRSCWPVQDKKQEGEFRSAAFRWVVEIAEASPEFFPQGKPLVRVFVKPSGEQCLRFIESFIQFTMFTLATRKYEEQNKYPQQNKLPPVLHKFTANNDLKLRNAQLNNITGQWQKLTKNTVAVQKATMLKLQHLEDRQEMFEEKAKEREKWCEDELSTLVEATIERPDLFPPNAEELIRERMDFIRKQQGLLPEFEDPLASVINPVWKEKLQEAKEIYERISKFFQTYEHLWSALEAYEANHDAVLDMKKLQGKDEPVMGVAEFFAKITEGMNRLAQKLETGSKVPSELMNQIKAQNHRIEKVRERRRKLKNPIENMEEAMRNIMFEIKATALKLEGKEWGRLSKCQEFFAGENPFSWTPPSNDMDLRKETGLTPAYAQPSRMIPDSTFSNGSFLTPKSSKTTNWNGCPVETANSWNESLEETIVDTERLPKEIRKNEASTSSKPISKRPITIALETVSPTESAESERQELTQLARVNRMLDAFRHSRSPTPSNLNVSDVQAASRRRSSIARVLPRDPEVGIQEDGYFGVASILEDLDGAVGGIMDESMCQFFEDDSRERSLLEFEDTETMVGRAEGLSSSGVEATDSRGHISISNGNQNEGGSSGSSGPYFTPLNSTGSEVEFATPVGHLAN